MPVGGINPFSGNLSVEEIRKKQGVSKTGGVQYTPPQPNSIFDNQGQGQKGVNTDDDKKRKLDITA